MSDHPPSVVLHFDGGITSNPGGQMSIGWWCSTADKPDVPLAEGGGRVAEEFEQAHRTNNTAEFLAARAGLLWLRVNAPPTGWGAVQVIGDSQFVLRCISGVSGTSKRHLLPLMTECRREISLLRKLSSDVRFTWAKRTENKLADALCRRDQAAVLLPGIEPEAAVVWRAEAERVAETAPARFNQLGGRTMFAWLNKWFVRPALPLPWPDRNAVIRAVLDSLCDRPQDWRLRWIDFVGYALEHRSGKVEVHSDGWCDAISGKRDEFRAAYFAHPSVVAMRRESNEAEARKMAAVIRAVGGDQ